MEAWTAIFRHLQEVGNRGDEEGQDDPGLRRFATALKTPRGRGNTDLLNSPKRLRMTEEGDDESVTTAGTAWDARVSHLKLTHSLALVKEELGSRDNDASYVTVHGGLQGSWDQLRALERAVAQDRLGLASKADDTKVGLILTQATAAWNKAAAAESLADQLVAMGGTGRIIELKEDVKTLSARIQELEDTMEKASEFCLNLSAHVSTLSGKGGSASSTGSVPLEDFQSFKAAHDDSLASIHQELKGGAIEIGGFVFNGEDACIVFAREHLTRDLTYHCIPSLMFALCMPSDEVIYKDDMQGDKMHAVRTSRNPMQLAVILSVNTTIPPILEGPKDSSLREAKHDFNAARTFEDWMPVGSLGGTARNLTSGVVRAFDRIQGTINLTLGSPQAKCVMMELRGEFITHFQAIFATEVTSYYQEILGKTGGAPPHTAEVKATCWALVTKLLKVLFKEIHKVRMFASELGTIRDDNARVNGLFLYAAFEELRVLRDFASHDYRRRPKYNQCVVLPVYEKRTDGAGRDALRFTRLETCLTEHKLHLERLESAVGSIRAHLNMPSPAARHRKRGGKGAGDGVEELE
jgi:hypothetical protein